MRSSEEVRKLSCTQNGCDEGMYLKHIFVMYKVDCQQ